METVADWLVGAGSTALMVVVIISWLASVRVQKSARTIPIHGGYFVRVATAPMDAWRESRSQHLREPRFKVFGFHRADPVLNDIAFGVEEKELRLSPETILRFGVVIRRVVNVKIEEINLSSVFCFQPMHDGRHAAARVSPEGEELHQLRPACGTQKSHIAGAQFGRDGWVLALVRAGRRCGATEGYPSDHEDKRQTTHNFQGHDTVSALLLFSLLGVF